MSSAFVQDDIPEFFEPSDSPGGSVRSIHAMTANGAFTIDGKSGGIGNEIDSALLHHARLWADCILVGAQTVRSEEYSGAKANPSQRTAREAQGQEPVPVLAVLTGTLNLDPTSPFFTDTSVAPIVLCSEESLVEHQGKATELLATGAQLRATGTQPHQLLDTLQNLGHQNILIEGGPSLYQEFFAAQLVDTMYVTIAPMTSSFSGHGNSPSNVNTMWSLDRCAASGDGYLFLRYRALK